MPRAGDRVEDILPAAVGLVQRAADEGDPGNEAVGNMRVLVKSDLAVRTEELMFL